jgi:hypothetical protein
MKKLALVFGLLFLALALVFVLAAWWGAWADYWREVNRRRLVWGPQAEVPSFDPSTLFLPGRMPEYTETHYVYAAPCAAAGALFMFLWRTGRPNGKNKMRLT